MKRLVILFLFFNIHGGKIKTPFLPHIMRIQEEESSSSIDAAIMYYNFNPDSQIHELDQDKFSRLYYTVLELLPEGCLHRRAAQYYQTFNVSGLLRLQKVILKKLTVGPS